MSNKAVGFSPHAGQQRVIDTIIGTTAKYITVVSPRQQGKSLLLVNLLLYYGINVKGCKIGVVAPIYSQARKLMEDLYEAIKNSGIVESTNFSNHEIKLKTGSKIYFRSSEREDGLRGYTFDYLFLDEASYQSEDAWKRALQPTILVHGKKCVLFSTPRGHDYFYEMFQMGQDPSYPSHASVRMEQYDNPYINKEEVEAAKRALPDAIFRAEYLGEFLEGESQVFQNFNSNTFERYPQAQGKCYIGVDLAQTGDYTVAVVMDATGAVLEIYRDNHKEWEDMSTKIVQLAQRYNATVMLETNSMGSVILEGIRKRYQDTHGFNTSNQSKRDIVESLILGFNEGTVKIPSNNLYPELHRELEVFEMTYNPQSRSVKYAARPPFHDDLVIALCIANWNRLQNKTYGQYHVSGAKPSGSKFWG
jgi:phage FluMu gp28-like protein